jgi:hypothetical protein
MPLRGPKGAKPTLRGWVNPKTGELLKSQRISQADIDEWNGVAPQPAPSPEPEEVPTDWNEDGTIDELESMTKAQLEQLGRDHGVELDRRKNKATLIEELREILPK